MQDQNLTRQEKKIRTRELIVATALELFLKDSYTNVSTQQIADKANLAKGTLFHHFPKKELLAIAALEYLFLEFSTQITDLRSKHTALEVIEIVCTETFAMALESHGIVKLTMEVMHFKNLSEEDPQSEAEKLIKQTLDSSFAKIFLPYITEFTELFDEIGIKEPEIKSRLFLAMMDGIGFQAYLLDGKDYKKYIAKMIKASLELFIPKKEEELI